MKVFLDGPEGWQQIGDADVTGNETEHVVRLFGSASVLEERFRIVTASGVTPEATAGERVVLAAPGQMTELLPDWRPLVR